jgi:hypothetical protein
MQPIAIGARFTTSNAGGQYVHGCWLFQMPTTPLGASRLMQRRPRRVARR